MLQSAVWIEVVLTMPTAEGWVVCLQLREQLHRQARELGGGGPGRVGHRVWCEGPVKSFLKTHVSTAPVGGFDDKSTSSEPIKARIGLRLRRFSF